MSIGQLMETVGGYPHLSFGRTAKTTPCSFPAACVSRTRASPALLKRLYSAASLAPWLTNMWLHAATATASILASIFASFLFYFH